MLTSRGSKLQDVDVQYHLQRASKVFHMNRWILQDRNVSIVKRLRYFESVVSSVACFAGGHRTMYNRHLEGRWIQAAMNRDVWDQHCKSFIEFCCTVEQRDCILHQDNHGGLDAFRACAPKRARQFGVQA